jgi:hypothetical protein
MIRPIFLFGFHAVGHNCGWSGEPQVYSSTAVPAFHLPNIRSIGTMLGLEWITH